MVCLAQRKNGSYPKRAATASRSEDSPGHDAELSDREYTSRAEGLAIAAAGAASQAAMSANLTATRMGAGWAVVKRDLNPAQRGTRVYRM